MFSKIRFIKFLHNFNKIIAIWFLVHILQTTKKLREFLHRSIPEKYCITRFLS